MSEVREGIRHAFAIPWMYDGFQKLVGAYLWRRKVIEQLVVPNMPHSGKLVDIGCGTAEVLTYLPKGIEYIGFDRNAAYIDQAKRHYRDYHNATFTCEELSLDCIYNTERADVVLALGLIHHLDDGQTLDLFRLAKKILGTGGFLLTLDPLYTPKQSALARYIISKDRGTAVRTELAYKELASKIFSNVGVYVDENPLRIPYTGIVMKCAS